MAGGKHIIGAVLTLRDNMSATLRGVRKEQSTFRKDVNSTRKELEKTFKKEHKARLDATAAHKELSKLKKNLEPLKKKVVTAMALKDMASRKINKTANEVKALGRRIASPIVKIKDLATPALSKIGSKLKSVAKAGAVGVAGAAVTAGALAGASVGNMIGSGMELEKQQVSMEHFIGINNKDKSAADIKNITSGFMNDLRENSNSTPFTTQEVIQAGTRALGVVGGDTKEAMNLVKVAEDMAALTPGKTAMDAMEALADARDGEMERLKEFNAKVSAEDFQKLGFKGIVDTKLKSQFEGGAAKLSGTGSGLVSTIKGKLQSRAQDAGLQMVEKMKPTLEQVIKLIDNPAFSNFSSKIGGGISFGINKIGEFAGAIKQHIPEIKAFIEPFFNKFTGYYQFLGEKSDFVKGVIATGWDTIKEVFTSVQPVASSIFDLMVNGCKLVWEAFDFAFPYIKDTVKSAWDFIKPILEPLGEALGWVTDKVGAVAGWIGKKNDERKATSKNISIDGSHANGLDYVPFDGYIAELHKGERVQTAAENPFNKISSSSSENSKSSGSDKPTVIININATDKSTNEIINELMPALKIAIANR